MVTRLLLELLVAPALVAAAGLASRRWREQVGGLVSAFPAIAGPVLLIDAHEHGATFAASAADATLLGLVAFSGFVVAYGRLCARRRWPAALAAGWAAAAACELGAAAFHPSRPTGLLAGGLSLSLAARLLDEEPSPGIAPEPGGPDLPLQMAVTAGLVASLAYGADRLGPFAGGMLASLPVLACVLAVFTHAHRGADAVRELLRGMLRGMLGFVAFCALVELLARPAGTPAAFVVATGAAIAVQAASARTMPAPPALP